MKEKAMLYQLSYKRGEEYVRILSVPVLMSYERALAVSNELRRKKLASGEDCEIAVFSVSTREARQHNKKVKDIKKYGYCYF